MFILAHYSTILLSTILLSNEPRVHMNLVHNDIVLSKSLKLSSQEDWFHTFFFIDEFINLKQI